jgi:hypothetical protein
MQQHNMPTDIDKIVDGFPCPTIVPITSVPTYKTIDNLNLQLNANAASVQSNLDSGLSGLLLERKGSKSSGKIIRALNIHYFFMADQVEKGNVSIEYCPTDEMIGGFHTKPLQGEKFRKFQTEILGC